MKINKAMEVKVAVMSFQSMASGVPPSVIVATQPQRTNETIDFVQKLNAAEIEVGYKNYSYTNFCVDGVSSESDDVCRSICDFLSGVSGFLGCNDDGIQPKTSHFSKCHLI